MPLTLPCSLLESRAFLGRGVIFVPGELPQIFQIDQLLVSIVKGNVNRSRQPPSRIKVRWDLWLSIAMSGNREAAHGLTLGGASKKKIPRRRIGRLRTA